MIRLAALILAGVIGIVAVDARQGATASPPNQRTSAPPATAIVAGKVVDGGSGAPVGEVTLTLSGGALNAPPPGVSPIIGSSSQGRRVITDTTGRFLFRDLPAGTFTLNAASGGYLNSSAGVMRPGGVGQSVVVPQDGRVLDVVVRMFKYSVISGTLTDEAGEPVVGNTMRCFKVDYVGGYRRLTGPSGTSTTDDRGAYRLAGLIPGEYVVAFLASSISMPAEALVESERARAAGSAESSAFSRDVNASGGNLFTQPSIAVGDWRLLYGTNARPPTPTDDGRVFSYTTTFHAGSPTAQNATTVTVNAGEEKAGIDFQIRPVPMARVSGTVMGPDGPVKFFGLRLLAADVADQFASDSTSDPIVSTTTATGAFSFLAVAPGSYILKAIKVPEPNGPTAVVYGPSGQTLSMRSDPSTPSTLPSLWASVPVQVAGDDVRDVAVTLREGLRISGHVEFDGVAPPPPPDRMKQIQVAIDPPGSGFGGSNFSYFQNWRGQLAEAGTFKSVQLPPGHYFIRNPTAPQGWFLDSILANGRDVSDVGLDLTSSDVTDVVVHFTDKMSQLTGVVKTAQGQNDPTASVLLFPTDSSMWTGYSSTPRRLRIARVTTTGSFGLATLPPGDYLVAAINDAAAGAWPDPKFLARVAPVAVRVTIERGQSKTLELSTVTVK